MDNEWQQVFDRQADSYLDEPYTRYTIEEVDFLIEELGISPGDRVMDVGCGVGRHSIELAGRGYLVTAFDLSRAMLKRAQTGANQAEVELDLFQADAAAVGLSPLHDAAICLCEGGFGLLAGSSDPMQQPAEILAGISRSLKPGAPLLLTAPNGIAKLREASAADVESGAFDPVNLVERFEIDLESGTEQDAIQVNERGFVPSELLLLARTAGFEPRHLWGGTAGGWHRQRPKLDEIELMLVAQKSEAKQG